MEPRVASCLRMRTQILNCTYDISNSFNNVVIDGAGRLPAVLLSLVIAYFMGQRQVFVEVSRSVS